MNIFVQFDKPKKGVNEKWFVRSITRDLDGFHFFLTFDNDIRQPCLGKTFQISTYTLSCETELEAHLAGEVYYHYHKTIYPYGERLAELTGNDTESQTMRFK